MPACSLTALRYEAVVTDPIKQLPMEIPYTVVESILYAKYEEHP